jgi:hypothetical protein
MYDVAHSARRSRSSSLRPISGLGFVLRVALPFFLSTLHVLPIRSLLRRSARWDQPADGNLIHDCYGIMRFRGPPEPAQCVDCGTVYPRPPGLEVVRLVAVDIVAFLSLSLSNLKPAHRQPSVHFAGKTHERKTVAVRPSQYLRE